MQIVFWGFFCLFFDWVVSGNILRVERHHVIQDFVLGRLGQLEARPM